MPVLFGIFFHFSIEGGEPSPMDNPEISTLQLKACYDEQGLLLRYPSRKSLRPPVLARLAEAFEPNRDYTEKEVNAIISRSIAFSDVELLRRELIEAHLLSRLRDGSRYWREQASL